MATCATDLPYLCPISANIGFEKKLLRPSAKGPHDMMRVPNSSTEIWLMPFSSTIRSFPPCRNVPVRFPVPAYRHLLHTTNALRRIAGELPESADNCAKFPRKYWGFPVRIVGTDDCIAALACGSKRGHIRHGSRHDHCPDNTKASCFQFPQSVGRSMGIVGVMAQHVR